MDPNDPGVGAEPGEPMEQAAPESQTNPFDSWGEYFDPNEVDPNELAQWHKFGQAVQGENYDSTMTAALREWGELQEDESLEDVRQALELIRNGGDLFADDDEYGEYGVDEQGFQTVPEHLQNFDPDQYKQEILEQANNDFQSQLLMNHLTSSLESVASEHGLNDAYKQRVWDRAMNDLQQGKIQPDRVGTLIEDTYRAEESFLNERLAQMAKPSVEPPPPGPGASPASPGNEGPAMSVRDLAKRTISRMPDE